MPVPRVKYCLICEDLRPEQHGLATIIGFYGITPDVTVYVKDFSKPIRQLTFCLWLEPGRLSGQIGFELTDEQNTNVITATGVSIDVHVQADRLGALALAASNVQFQNPGLQTLKVKFNDELFHTTTFKAMPGLPT